MKKLLMLFVLIAGMMACGSEERAANAKPTERDRVEVIYFYGKQRCATCIAIEKNTKELIETMFSQDVKNGKIVFRTVDISTPEGEALADKYEVTWASLFVNKWHNGKETRNNLTEFGFSSARKNPEGFKRGLATKIRQALK